MPEEQLRLEKATASTSPYVGNPYGAITYRAGDIQPGAETLASARTGFRDYRDEVRRSRFYYHYDPLASAVLNRMVDMAAAKVKNRRGGCTNEEIAYYNGITALINPLVGTMMLEYLVTGMVLPEYGLSRMMGSRIHTSLGRKRYQIPSPLWVRNTDHIILKKMPSGMQRAVFLQVPEDERAFIQNKGKMADGTEQKELYEMMLRKFPEYVALIQEGRSLIPLDNAHPILRKALANEDYPQPYLVPSLAAFQHKWRIKQMDYNIATRAIEAIRHVKVGNDTFPVVEGDNAIEDIRQQLANRPGFYAPQESLYTLYTNHTVEFKWVYPPLEALLSDAKYAEPNSDILLGMGFSRALLVGESLRSNSGGNASTMGPLSTLTEMRDAVVFWVKELYQRLADANGFRNTADPFFPAIQSAELIELIQYALQAVQVEAMSKDTMLQMFGSDYELEKQQRATEAKDVDKEDVGKDPVVLDTPEEEDPGLTPE